MRKFTDIYKQKKNITEVQVNCYKREKKEIFLVTEYDPFCYGRCILNIFKCYSKFPTDISLFRRKIPFYTLDYSKFIHVFYWIFIFSLLGVIDEKF